MGLPALLASSLALLDSLEVAEPHGHLCGNICNAGLGQHCLPGLVPVQAVPCWGGWCALGWLPSTWHWCQQTGQAGSHLLLAHWDEGWSSQHCSLGSDSNVTLSHA